MNKNNLARLGNKYPHKSVKSAVSKLTKECMLQLIVPTKITRCVGFGENALAQYTHRLEWLRGRQRTINHWLQSANRSEVQIAVAGSLTATHTYYADVLKSLITQCSQAMDLEKLPTTLFSLHNVRQGEIRYVKNVH